MGNLLNYFAVKEEENLWKNTPLEEYAKLPARTKGATSEKILKQYFTDEGYEVKDATGAGHDLILNGKKTELKFGLATKRNEKWETIFNHIGLKKDWEQILFVCVNGDCSYRMVIFQKDNLPLEFMNYQQGGKAIENDDFMINGKNAAKLLFDTRGEVIC